MCNYINVLRKKIDTYDVIYLLILAHAHTFSFYKAGFYGINFLLILKNEPIQKMIILFSKSTK